MSLAFFDRVKETSTTTGTGNFTLAGAVTGFRAFSAVLSVGTPNYTVYVIANEAANQWEIGVGYLSASTTLVRDAVYTNSSGTTLKINFSAGTKNVFISQVAKFGSNNHMLAYIINGTPESYNNITAFGYVTTIGGNGATAVGSSASANAINTTAYGLSATASGTYSTAVGASATASGASSTAFGQASSASNTNAVALGDNATASGSSSTAVGKTVSATGTNSTAVGASATASTEFATAIGYGANVTTSNYGTAVGQYSTVTGNNAIAFGGGNTSSGNQSIAIGTSNNASGSDAIALGSSSTASGNNSIALGASLTANQSEQFLTYMRVNPSGLSGVSVKYDSAAREMYAETGGGGGGVTSIIAGTNVTITSTGPGGTGDVTINATGGGPPVGINWATYQDNDMTSAPLSLATPSSTTSSPYSTYFFSSAVGPSGGSWMYSGSAGGGISNVYSNNSYPITTPITSFAPPFNGAATCYFPSWQNDPGATNSFLVATGTTVYSNFSSTLFMNMGWPVFGATRYGHYIAVISGSYVGAFSGSTGCTKVAEFYDMWSNYTYFFINCDSTAVANMSSGMPVGTFGGSSASYQAIFWYNY